jgi:hypothetical protein
MIGPHVTDLISEACLALRLESTTEEITRTIHPHPTLSETVAMAAEAFEGTITEETALVDGTDLVMKPIQPHGLVEADS